MEVILRKKPVDPERRIIVPKAPRQTKRTKPFRTKFLNTSRESEGSNKEEWIRQPTYLYDAFSEHVKIGQGSFGTVYRVTCNQIQEKSAVKVLSMFSLYNWKNTIGKVVLHDRINEHLNIVRLYNSWVEDDILYIQMELCKQNLLQFIMENVEKKEQASWDVLCDMLMALGYIHSHRLIHLDVKPENILIGFDGRYKLADFDLISEYEIPSSYMRAGDDKYRAPEVMHGTFSPKNDIFSLGMTLLEMAGDFILPNGGKEWEAMRRDSFPYSQLAEDISSTLLNIIMNMTKQNMDERPSAERLLSLGPVSDVVKSRYLVPVPRPIPVQKLISLNSLKLKKNIECMNEMIDRDQIDRCLDVFVGSDSVLMNTSQESSTTDDRNDSISSPDGRLPGKKLSLTRRLFQ